MDNLERSRIQRAADRAKLAEDRLAEIAAFESRKGELPTMEQSAIDSLKAQIEQARVDKQTAKDSLTTTKTEQHALKVTLQAQLDAAVGAAAKAPIRLQVDACNAAIAQANAALDEAALTLDSLRLAKEEALFQERLAKKALRAEDAARVKAEKDEQERDIREKRDSIAKLAPAPR